MNNKTLTELILEAQSTLDAIALHRDSVALKSLENWDDPAIFLGDARLGLIDLHHEHFVSLLSHLNTELTTVSPCRPYDGLWVWCNLDNEGNRWHFLEWGCKCDLSLEAS